jgi:hydrogenase nickel incorporation protein HypB
MHKEHTREIKVVQDILSVNDRFAEQNRKEFADLGIFVLNVMSSPGSGKTTLLTNTLKELRHKIRIGVVVGDICTTNDADRLSLDGHIPTVQICTDAFGGDCHLAAHVIKDAVSGLDLSSIDMLIVENIGNLVCPAEFDIGEDKRVVVLSVTEGEDKPVKYPLMFQVCDIAVLNKIDLLPYLEYDKDAAVRYIHDVHPEMPVLELAGKTGEGMDQWFDWILEQIENKKKVKSL